MPKQHEFKDSGWRNFLAMSCHAGAVVTGSIHLIRRDGGTGGSKGVVLNRKYKGDDEYDGTGYSNGD